MNSHAVDGVRAFAVLALLALVATLPSFLWGPGVTDSAGYNYVWTKQFGDGLARGELYPRWLTQSFEGLGSPTFYFYPPLAFYLTGLVQAAGMPTLQTVNVAGAVLLFGSGAAMYAWLRFKRGHALLGACLYMAAPYHLADFYIRGALAEFAAFVWLPLIALGIEALPRRWAPPLLAFAYAALILTHLPMGLLTTVALIVPMAAHRLLKAPRLLIPFTVSGLLGLGLSAVYLFPALSLQPHITTELLWSQPYYRPQSWFLLAPWGGVSKSLLAMFASLAAAAAWLAGAAAVSAWRAGDRRPAFWGGLVIGDAALALGLFPWFWELPLMEKVQFPWRLLAIVEFAAVTAIASTKLPRPLILVIAAAVALPGLGGLTVLTVRYLARNHASPEWIAHLDRQMPDAPEYLPAGFEHDRHHRHAALAETGALPPRAGYRR